MSSSISQSKSKATAGKKHQVSNVDKRATLGKRQKLDKVRPLACSHCNVVDKFYSCEFS